MVRTLKLSEKKYNVLFTKYRAACTDLTGTTHRQEKEGNEWARHVASQGRSLSPTQNFSGAVTCQKP